MSQRAPMTMEAAQDHVAGLEAEGQTIQADIRELERQRADQQGQMNRLYALAERQPTDDNRKAASEAEARLDDLAYRIRRKQAALESVELDLAAAKQAAAQTELDERVKHLEALHQEAEGLAAKLDNGSFLHLPTWQRLDELYREGQHLLLGELGRREADIPCRDPGQARANRLKALELDLARVKSGERGRWPSSMREALVLERAALRIASLHEELRRGPRAK